MTSYLNKEGLSESIALRVVYFAAKGIKHLHENMILHRDIRPESILFDSAFNVKICNFAKAKKITKNEKRSSIVGGYDYMSPEVVKETKYDFKIDVWSLGILLYELLHGSIIRKTAFFSRPTH